MGLLDLLLLLVVLPSSPSFGWCCLPLPATTTKESHVTSPFLLSGRAAVRLLHFLPSWGRGRPPSFRKGNFNEKEDQSKQERKDGQPQPLRITPTPTPTTLLNPNHPPSFVWCCVSPFSGRVGLHASFFWVVLLYLPVLWLVLCFALHSGRAVVRDVWLQRSHSHRDLLQMELRTHQQEETDTLGENERGKTHNQEKHFTPKPNELQMTSVNALHTPR